MTVNKGAFYFITFLQLLVLAGLLIGAAFVADTRDKAVTRDSVREACDRNNLIRDAVHFNTGVTVERALLEGDRDTFKTGTQKLAALTLAASRHPQKDRPWLVNCTAAYP